MVFLWPVNPPVLQKVKPILLLFQGLLSIGLFLGVWKGASLINWVSREKVDALNEKVEQKLGNLVWGYFERTHEACDVPSVNNAVDSILTVLCKANGFARNQISLHVLVNHEVNAMALPDRHLVVYTGLLRKAENQAQVAGVLAHELAHMQERHVMKKLAKELGIAAVTSLAGLSGSAEAARQILEVLASRAYDRSLETEADTRAVDYLLAAKINPNELADFFVMLAGESASTLPDWLNTHPATEGRSERIRELAKGKTYDASAFSNADAWKVIKAGLPE
jgi:predicted Zn-dependent protease